MITPRFEKGFPDNWIQLRDNWNVYARKQEEVPAIIAELEQAFNRTPAEEPVNTSTPYNETASGAGYDEYSLLDLYSGFFTTRTLLGKSITRPSSE